MAIASGANVGLSYVQESTHGTTPASPTMLTLRATNRNINLTKNTLTSNERRSDRQIATVRHGFNQVVGSPGFELSLQAYDDMIQGALGGSWAAVTTGSTTITIGASDDLTLGTGTWPAALTTGDIIDISGYATSGTDGQYRISSVDSTTQITVTNLDGTAASLASEAGGGDEVVAVTGKKISVGSTLITYTFERLMTDLTKYQVFKGVAVNQMSFSIQPEQIVGGTLDLIGMEGAAISGSSLGTPTAAPTAEPFSAFEGSLYEGGTEIAVVTGLDFQIANNRTLEGVVGSKISPDVFEGDCVVTGTLSAFFESETMWNKFYNETASSIDLKLDDLDGTNFMRIRMGNVKYTGGDMDPPQSGPVTVSMPFQALVDSSTSTSIEFQRSNT